MSDEILKYYNFAGGRNDFDPPDSISDNQYVDGEDTQLVGSKLKTRGGYTALNTTTGAYRLTGLFNSYVAGSNYVLAMDTRGYVYRMDYTSGSPDGTFDTISPSAFGTGVNIRWSVTDGIDGSGNRILILTNNNGEPQKWVGGANNTANLSASTDRPTVSKIVSQYGFRIIHDNITDNSTVYPFRSRWSNFDDALTFDLNDFKDWPNDGSEGLTCSFIQRGYRYIATSKSIHRMTYTGYQSNNSAVLPFVFDEFICKNRGIVGPNAYTDVEGVVILLSSDKRLYLFDGGCYFEVGREIRNLLNALTESRLEYVWMKYDSGNKELLIGCDTGSSGANDTIICGNCEGFSADSPTIRWNNPWVVPANCIAIVDIAGEFLPYFGDSAATGLAYKSHDGTNDNGSAVTANVLSKAYNFGTDANKKDLRALDLSIKGQTGANDLTYDIYRDGSSSSGSTGVISQTSASNPYKPKPMKTITGISDFLTFQVRFTQDAKDKEFEIYKFGFVGQPGNINF